MDAATQPDTNPEEAQEVPAMQRSNMDLALSLANLAEDLQKNDIEELMSIGRTVVDGYTNDEQSRTEWMTRNKEYMKLATQVMEKKSFPWEGAANVKYPLLTTAALQFASRAYSSLVPSFDVVKAKVIGDDPDGQLTEVANKFATHMSYQMLYEIDDWEENMDKLCFILPIVGTMFKKVYADYNKKICSDLLAPKDVCVNYYTKRIEDSSRITEICWYTANEIKELQNKGIWLSYEDFDFGPGMGASDDREGATLSRVPTPDKETPRKILIQYCRIDLDDDGYEEPYIVTVDEESQKVVRIAANFYSSGIEYKDEGKTEIACITPSKCFVKFDFLPNPDGGFYGIGFGILLGGLNDMVNTITNQLIDAGTLANLQAGFIGRGLRDNKTKDMKFRPGEWKWVNNPGKDIKENVFPLPIKEPSSTLFNLLGTLVQSGKEVASVADIFTGKMPGQNTPASTTMAAVEQGLKVFTSIYKRIYRAMGKEFTLVFELLKMYAPSSPIKVVGTINGEEKAYSVSKFDYQQKGDLVKIIPAADPNMVSETQKLMKIQGLMELVQFGSINVQEMTRQALIYQGQDSIQKLMTMPPPQPPLEIQIQQMKSQDLDKDRQLEGMRMMGEMKKLQSDTMLNMAKAQELGDQKSMLMLEAQIEKQQADMELHMEWLKLMFEREKHQMEMKHNEEMHQQDMAAKEAETRLNLTLAKTTGVQDIHFNEARNQQALKQGEAKHQQTMQQAKEKSKLKESNAK